MASRSKGQSLTVDTVKRSAGEGFRLLGSQRKHGGMHAAVVIAVERPIRWPGSNGIIDVLEIRNRWGTRPRLGAIVAGRWHSVVGIGRLATIGRFWR